MAVQQLMLGAGGKAQIYGIEDLFHIHTYTGTGDETNSSTGQDIVTGLDLSANDGMVMIKRRDNTGNNAIVDTIRGAGRMLTPHDDWQPTAEDLTSFKSFNNNGFSLGSESGGYQRCNMLNGKYLSYTFMKHKKFFDVLTYTGTGSARTVPHGLGSVPGMIVVKRVSGNQYETEHWQVYHRSVGNEEYLEWDETTVKTDNVNRWNDTSPTASVFSVGDHSSVNADGATYVAYLFAHDEAEFGAAENQSVIKCGGYTGNGGTQEINVGFEPQLLLIKSTTVGDAWLQIDSMRGIEEVTPNGMSRMDWNTNGQEFDSNFIYLTPNGFKTRNTNDTQVNNNNQGYIYLAIAAETGKTMKAIETGSDVFDIDTGNGSATGPALDSNFAVDMLIKRAYTSSSDWGVHTRLTGAKDLRTNGTEAEGNDANGGAWDYPKGVSKNQSSSIWGLMWKRYAGFDVVTYTGNNTAGTQISHSLGQAPEMIWVKDRDSGSLNWNVYHKDLNGGNSPEDYYLVLNENYEESDSETRWNDTAPTATNFTIGSSDRVNSPGDNYLAILFASVDGVSKCGVYEATGHGGSGSGGAVVVNDVGFSPRFILIKNITTDTGTRSDWHVFDTTRGLTSGSDDKKLILNSNAAQSGEDWIDPTSDGFTIEANIGNDLNYTSGDKYIYYAHA